jgi:pyruvate/2-oxoglutarate dehydrogenase complex dihydrolipoamide dehydrogenase (E3) component
MGSAKRIAFDAVLVRRGPRRQPQGLRPGRRSGIPTTRTVDTNEFLQTIYPNIYAAGDVAGPYQFTHTAAHQAWYAAVNALFGPSRNSRPTTR